MTTEVITDTTNRVYKLQMTLEAIEWADGSDLALWGASIYAKLGSGSGGPASEPYG